jgi:hypothetical protein
MAAQQELQVQQKREVDKAQEPTRPMRAFLPTTDIFETEDALTVILEMPGVDRDNIEVRTGSSPSKAESTSTSMRASSLSIANTISVLFGEASAFRAESIRTRSAPRCGMV